jgi:hypothetical protein
MNRAYRTNPNQTRPLTLKRRKKERDLNYVGSPREWAQPPTRTGSIPVTLVIQQWVQNSKISDFGLKAIALVLKTTLFISPSPLVVVLCLVVYLPS